MERGLGSSDSRLKVIWLRVRARRLVSVNSPRLRIMNPRLFQSLWRFSVYVAQGPSGAQKPSKTPAAGSCDFD